MFRHCTSVLDSKRNDSRVGKIRIRDFQISRILDRLSIINLKSSRISVSTSDLDSHAHKVSIHNYNNSQTHSLNTLACFLSLLVLGIRQASDIPVQTESSERFSPLLHGSGFSGAMSHKECSCSWFLGWYPPHWYRSDTLTLSVHTG